MQEGRKRIFPSLTIENKDLRLAVGSSAILAIFSPTAMYPEVLFGVFADRLAEAVVEKLGGGGAVGVLGEADGRTAHEAVVVGGHTDEGPHHNGITGADRETRGGREGPGRTPEERKGQAFRRMLVH